MRSSFFGLNVAKQGLFTARTWLDITNHNISNSETEGYSRQYGVQSASRPLPNNGIGMLGTGSEITNISHYRNEYLDMKFWNNASNLGEYSVKNSLTSDIETILNEVNDTGMSTEFEDMFEALSKLSTYPSEEAYKINFIDMAKSYTKYFNDIGEQMRSVQRDANFSIKIKVDQINNLSNEIATVNKQIEDTEFTGAEANDLRDKRALLVDKLSKIINVSVDERTGMNNKKTYSVYANNKLLVEASSFNTLETKSREGLRNPEDEPGLYDIYWQDGTKLDLANSNLEGELKGYIDIRDGNNGNNFRAVIDTAVTTLPSKIVVVKGMNRNDIPEKGEITIDGKVIKYNKYDRATNTFELDEEAKAGATNISMGQDMKYKGVSYYAEKLNKFVRTVAQHFNEIHEKGYGGTGGPLFTYDGYVAGDPVDYNHMTIDNLQFSEEIEDNIDKLLTRFDKTAGVSDGDLIEEILDLKHDNDMFQTGEPGNYIQALVGELGIDKSQADSFETGQTNLNLLIDNQRLSFSGVDINEESVSIIKYQQAYMVSAQMIRVFDEIYDVTINRMGAS